MTYYTIYLADGKPAVNAFYESKEEAEEALECARDTAKSCAQVPLTGDVIDAVYGEMFRQCYVGELA